jgi:hypothetical protein
VFDIDVQHCPNCGGGELKIIAAILERPVIDKILAPLGLDPQPPPQVPARGPVLPDAALSSTCIRTHGARDRQGWLGAQQPGRRWAAPGHDAFDIRVDPEVEAADAPSERSRNCRASAVRR